MREPPRMIHLDAYAFFIDFDGTLVEIAEKPELVQLSPATTDAIVRLRERLSCALAIISGRELADIDAYFKPHLLPVASVHGLLRRDAAGHFHEASAMDTLNDNTRAEIQARLQQHPGILIEAKPGTVAIHYRGVPEAGPLCRNTALAVAAHHPDLHVLEGKMVVELKPKTHDKGTAIRAFMAEPPFAGRQPVFIGDDVTDEDGFRAVNDLDGISIKIGEGSTSAPFRMANSAAFIAWLTQLSNQ